ncbi:MAG: dienelactone hydrolase family protein [Alphaproteobacteria bacterium]|nr:dienelactone hydrolase family protein [Alphaproteobacteria bacterium]
MRRRLSILTLLAVLITGASGAFAQKIAAPFPDGAEMEAVAPRKVAFPTSNPYILNDVGDPDVPAEEAVATFYRAQPVGPAPDGAKRPAVLLLHGAGGVQSAREHRYGREFAAMGVHALVVDAFAARRDMASGFTNRLINITEAMLIADAYAGLDWLTARPDIDPARIAFIGFSYGGMASLYAAHELVTGRYRPNGETRFAAHVAFYAPCIARFEDARSNGAPVLMLWGTADNIVDGARCRENADALRAGGGTVETVEFEGAAHTWDGGYLAGWRAPRGLRNCDLTVTDSGAVRDSTYFIPLLDSITRKAILGLCADTEGYLIKADPAIRARSNAILASFLAPILTP